MKTAEEIRNEVAKGIGYKDWNELYQKSFVYPEIVDKVAKRYAEEALKEAALKFDLGSSSDGRSRNSMESILNLIKELK